MESWLPPSQAIKMLDQVLLNSVSMAFYEFIPERNNKRPFRVRFCCDTFNGMIYPTSYTSSNQ